MVLGKEVMHAHDLVLLKVITLWCHTAIYFASHDILQDGYFDGYDPYTNPSAASGFTSAAFRWKKSLFSEGARVDTWIGGESKAWLFTTEKCCELCKSCHLRGCEDEQRAKSTGYFHATEYCEQSPPHPWPIIFMNITGLCCQPFQEKVDKLWSI